MPTNRKRRTRDMVYLPQSMQDLLLYGTFDDSDPDESFDAWLIKIHPDASIKEWQKFRDQLLPTWKHSCTPYAEALSRDETPDRTALKELFAKEMSK